MYYSKKKKILYFFYNGFKPSKQNVPIYLSHPDLLLKRNSFFGWATTGLGHKFGMFSNVLDVKTNKFYILFVWDSALRYTIYFFQNKPLFERSCVRVYFHSFLCPIDFLGFAHNGQSNSIYLYTPDLVRGNTFDVYYCL